jgi:chromosome segregation ATPase
MTAPEPTTQPLTDERFEQIRDAVERRADHYNDRLLLLAEVDRLRAALAESETRRKDLARRLDQHRDDLVNVNSEIARIVSDNNAQADKLDKAERLAEGWMRARSTTSSVIAAEHFDALNECGASLARALDQSGEGQR